ncbi:MAG: EAL domain-containing protein, partial [Burkholderiales bacterium]
RSFTLALQPGRNTIVEAIISVAHTLGMRIVAEGVETEAQRDILRELGCDEMQGYLIARPMSHEEFTKWLQLRRGPHLIAINEGET